jgi:Uma2 family endonuclease
MSDRIVRHAGLPFLSQRRYRMVMPVARADWTVEMLDALPEDGQRYELIDGELFVTPAPSNDHQLVVTALAGYLWPYMRASDVGRVLISPSDVRRGDRERNRVQPDLFVVRLTDKKLPPYPFALSDLLLAIEVESPSNPFYDHQTKRELYLRAAVPDYWIVNAAARTVVRWRALADPGETLTHRLEWQPAGMAEPFVLDLPAFFDDALG